MDSQQEQYYRENIVVAEQTEKICRNIELCSTYHNAIEFIGRRWMGAILFVLMEGPQRFNVLLATIPGLSDRLLSERLRELEKRKLVIRRVITSSPIKVEYELTEAGRELQDVLDGVGQWAHKWFPDGNI